MKWMARFALVIGVALGAAAAVWMLRGRQVPQVRLSYTVGGGMDYGVDWIKLKDVPRREPESDLSTD